MVQILPFKINPSRHSSIAIHRHRLDLDNLPQHRVSRKSLGLPSKRLTPEFRTVDGSQPHPDLLSVPKHFDCVSVRDPDNLAAPSEAGTGTGQGAAKDQAEKGDSR